MQRIILKSSMIAVAAAMGLSLAACDSKTENAAEDQAQAKAAGIALVVNAAGIRSHRIETGDGAAAASEHARVRIDPQSPQGECDSGRDSERIERRMGQRLLLVRARHRQVRGHPAPHRIVVLPHGGSKALSVKAP